MIQAEVSTTASTDADAAVKDCPVTDEVEIVDKTPAKSEGKSESVISGTKEAADKLEADASAESSDAAEGGVAEETETSGIDASSGEDVDKEEKSPAHAPAAINLTPKAVSAVSKDVDNARVSTEMGGAGEIAVVVLSFCYLVFFDMNQKLSLAQCRNSYPGQLYHSPPSSFPPQKPKTLTPKQRQLQEERLKKQEERDRVKRAKEEEKERVRLEKQKEKDEKLKAKQAEKEKIEREKEEARKAKEEEKRKKMEEQEAEKARKEEEKRKKEEEKKKRDAEKEEEKRRLEEEKRLQEEEKQREQKVSGLTGLLV